MANISARKGKDGSVVSYRFRTCVGRDEQYRQIWRTCTIKRPEGLTPAKERREVERLADAWEQEQQESFERNGSAQDKSKITLAEFVRAHWWLDHVLDGTHTPSSIAFYRNMSDDIVAYFGESKKLRAIDAEAVKCYIKYLNTEALTRSGKPYSAATITRHYQTLRNIINYALRFGYLKDDPCRYLSVKDKPRKETKQIDFLAPKDAQRFLAALESEPLFWRCFMNVLITCGLRRGEANGLQWGDIDGDTFTLNVARNVTIDKNSPDKIHIGETKGKESRTVPLSPRVYAMLMTFKHEQEEKYNGKLLPSAYIFCSTVNPYAPQYPTVPTRWQARFVKRHNLPNVSPHDLRHTAATLALEGGADLKQVQQLLGHKDPATTMRFYAGVTEEAERRTVQGIESVLASGEN